MKKLTCLLIVFFTAGFLSLQAVASGSGGYRHQNPTPKPKQVDPVYERGKALFKGREKSYGDVRVCINNGEAGKAVKIKKKHLKSYKSGSANALADNLYDCKNPDEKIAGIYQREDLSALVHYLNKRYRLKLSYR